jgi:hypothetical protein
VALAALLLPAGARAGGYDTPMLYSSRHMGMGGAAVGYVGDASALFHNPAGLAQIGRYHLLLDVSLLVGDLQASPVVGAENITSERTVAPAFLVGAAFRVHERVTLGVGVFPVAAAGGEYRYTQPGGSAPVVDRTSLNFFEFTPAIAVNIDEIGLRIGASYRITYVQLERARIPNPQADPQRPNLEINASGMDFLGFRLGVQYQPPQHPNLQLGLNYRHKTTTTVESSGPVYALGLPLGDVEASSNFVLPSRLELGARYDFGTANSEGHYAGGAAFDFIYAFNSQNDASGFRIGGIELVQVFDWTNGITMAMGGRVPHPGQAHAAAPGLLVRREDQQPALPHRVRHARCGHPHHDRGRRLRRRPVGAQHRVRTPHGLGHRDPGQHRRGQRGAHRAGPRDLRPVRRARRLRDHAQRPLPRLLLRLGLSVGLLLKRRVRPEQAVAQVEQHREVRGHTPPVVVLVHGCGREQLLRVEAHVVAAVGHHRDERVERRVGHEDQRVHLHHERVDVERDEHAERLHGVHVEATPHG